MQSTLSSQLAKSADAAPCSSFGSSTHCQHAFRLRQWPLGRLTVPLGCRQGLHAIQRRPLRVQSRSLARLAPCQRRPVCAPLPAGRQRDVGCGVAAPVDKVKNAFGWAGGKLLGRLKGAQAAESQWGLEELGDVIPRHWKDHLSSIESDGDCRTLAKHMKRVRDINELGPSMEALSQEELKCKTEEFKMRLESGKDTLDSLLPEAFAAVREASSRVLNMRHYDVQLIGGMILHEGMIAEMATGEGKTLMATLPAYLNALTGKGVHVVTVNPYLAARDAAWVGKIYKYLGLTVAYADRTLHRSLQRAAFAADITYAVASDLCFSFLEDKLKADDYQEMVLHRPFNYAIVDEVDWVLIDNCRSPFIISGNPTGTGYLHQLAEQVMLAAEVSQALSDNTRWQPRSEDGSEDKSKWLWFGREAPSSTLAHALVDFSGLAVTLTMSGLEWILRWLSEHGHKFDKALREGRKPCVADIWEDDLAIGPFLIEALKANLFQRRDRDYIVRDGNIKLINRASGRVLEDSRWQDGLHQAIEAKEGLEIRPMSSTAGTITHQCFFSYYSKLSGMTGTAAAAMKEFFEVYKLPVAVVPTHKPSQRLDHDMRILLDRQDQGAEILALVKYARAYGQPVLIGTNSVAESENIARLLYRHGIRGFQVLNAKPEAVRREAKIVALAGLPPVEAASKNSAITIATNMAGRGTDIKLGGDPRGLTQMCMESLLIPKMLPIGSDELDMVDAPPLPYWVTATRRGMGAMHKRLPGPLYDTVEKALLRIQTKFFETRDKVPYATAEEWVGKAMARAETLLTEFMFAQRKLHGPQQRGFERLLPELVKFSDERCPMQPISHEDSGTNAAARAALWLWVWLDEVCAEMAERAMKAGGLMVIITSLGNSKRVMDQFKGRCGRQGDPGKTFTLLSVEDDLIDSTGLMGFAFDKVEDVDEGFNQAALKNIVSKTLVREDTKDRDMRSETMRADNVINTFRQQTFALRRWVIGSEGSALHKMIQSFFYESAAALVAQHVDPRHPPSDENAWKLNDLLKSCWNIVNPPKRRPPEQLQVEFADAPGELPLITPDPFSLPIDIQPSPLLGVASPHDLAGVASQLRGALQSQQRSPVVSAQHLDLGLIAEQMERAKAVFERSSSTLPGSFTGRHAKTAWILVHYLATVLYVAYAGSKRAKIKDAIRVSTQTLGAEVIYDSSLAPTPENTGATSQTVMDLEELLQSWEKSVVAGSISTLWADVMVESDSLYKAAQLSIFANLSPVDEYRLVLSERYIQLLEGQRRTCVDTLFEGPELHMSLLPSEGARRKPAPGNDGDLSPEAAPAAFPATAQLLRFAKMMSEHHRQADAASSSALAGSVAQNGALAAGNGKGMQAPGTAASSAGAESAQNNLLAPSNGDGAEAGEAAENDNTAPARNGSLSASNGNAEAAEIGHTAPAGNGSLSASNGNGAHAAERPAGSTKAEACRSSTSAEALTPNGVFTPDAGGNEHGTLQSDGTAAIVIGEANGAEVQSGNGLAKSYSGTVVEGQSQAGGDDGRAYGKGKHVDRVMVRRRCAEGK